MMIAVYSALFPWYQEQRQKNVKWTRYYGPTLLLIVAIPLFMMGGQLRPILAVICVVLGLYMIGKNVMSTRQAA